MKYLVTGAAGFIGSQFVSSCNSRKIDVVSVDHEALFASRPQHSKINFGTQLDTESLLLKKPSELAEFLNRFSLDGIVHLGAITDTRESDPMRLSKYNVGCTQALWNYATHTQIPFVYASSAATYGDGELGYEDDETQMSKLKPLNLYGQSKLDFDLWAQAQISTPSPSCPPAWAGFKFFNVYGFGESHKGFMASVVLHSYEQICKTGQAVLFKSHRKGIADGHQKRDFVCVEDVVDVLHFALEKPIRQGVYNLGTGRARTFLDLAQAVFSALGKAPEIQFVETPIGIRDKYQYFTEARMEKLRKQGYSKPFTSLEEGVARYVAKLKASQSS